MHDNESGLLQYHNQLRGTVLSLTVEIEHIIDLLIANFYCADKEKRDEFINVVLPSDRVTLENKRQILEYIASNHLSKKLYNDKYHSLFKDLERRVIPKRNEFAHGKIYIKSELMEENNKETGLGFIRYKHGKEKLIWYTHEEIIDFLKLMEDCIVRLGELFEIESPPQ